MDGDETNATEVQESLVESTGAMPASQAFLQQVDSGAMDAQIRSGITAAIQEVETMRQGGQGDNSAAAQATEATKPEKPAMKEEPASKGIVDEPYRMRDCTIQVSLMLLPDDGNPDGRQVIVGVRNHLDAPLIRTVREAQLGPLPQMVQDMLSELEMLLPDRETQKKLRDAKRSGKRPASSTPPVTRPVSPAVATTSLVKPAASQSHLAKGPAQMDIFAALETMNPETSAEHEPEAHETVEGDNAANTDQPASSEETSQEAIEEEKE